MAHANRFGTVKAMAERFLEDRALPVSEAPPAGSGDFLQRTYLILVERDAEIVSLKREAVRRRAEYLSREVEATRKYDVVQGRIARLNGIIETMQNEIERLKTLL